MAGDWVPMRTELHEDPAVIGIGLAVRLDEFSVVGRLLRLWSWASSQTQDGYIPFVTPEKVDQIVQRSGFASAMLKVGWLKFLPCGGVEFPKYERWMSRSAKRRLDDSRRKAQERSSSGSECPKNVRECSDNLYSHSTLSPPRKDEELKSVCEDGARGFEEAVFSFSSVGSPGWFPAWAERHASRFGFRREDDPKVLAGWWLVLARIDPTEEELEKASLALLQSEKQPRGRPEHPRMLTAIIIAARKTSESKEVVIRISEEEWKNAYKKLRKGNKDRGCFKE